MTEMTPADVLDAAADALFIYGRARGVGVSEDGSMCVRGAILYAEGCNPADWVEFRSPALNGLEKYLQAHPEVLPNNKPWGGSFGYEDAYPSFVWNDQTEDDQLVIDTLKLCAKDLRASSEPS